MRGIEMLLGVHVRKPVAPVALYAKDLLDIQAQGDTEISEESLVLFGNDDAIEPNWSVLGK